MGLLLAGQAAAVAIAPGPIESGKVHDFAEGMKWIGLLLLFGSTLFLVKAQLDLGASWRIGVVDDDRPGLVTTGVYAWSRNPIYAAVLLMLTGYTILLPTWLSLVMLCGAVVG
ncbi:MAG: methyltransferase family protein, partial [Candidatus Binatia bacterium]